MTSKEEKLKAQLELATGMYKAFIRGGQLSEEKFDNPMVDTIDRTIMSIRSDLSSLMRDLAYRLHIERSFPTQEADSETK